MFSPQTCSVSAGNVGITRGFGGLMAAAAVVSLATGKTYYRRVIARDEEPGMYWSTVAGMGILAAFTLGLSLLCPTV
jgi:hypothetical protein